MGGTEITLRGTASEGPADIEVQQAADPIDGGVAVPRRVSWAKMLKKDGREVKHRLGFLAGAPRLSTRPEAEMSGPRARMLGLVNGFEALGWQVDSFVAGDHLPRSWQKPGSSSRLSRTGFFGKLCADIFRMGVGIVSSLYCWCRMRRRVDCVYEYAAVLQSLGWIFKLSGITWVLQVEAVLFREAKEDRKTLLLAGLAKRIEVWSYRQCDIIVCVSETLKALLVKEFSVPAEKIVVVPNGVDTEFLNPERHAPRKLFDDFTVGFVGSLYEWAGLDVLLAAIAELRGEGAKLAVVIVGGGEKKDEWEALVGVLGLEACVRMLGQVDWREVPAYIAGFDVGYSGQLPLRQGEMYLSPMKLYEYMAMAKPVVAAAHEDARRLVQEGETGFLFVAGDKKDLKRALRNAIESRSRLAEMGCRARSEIVARHTWVARVEALTNRLNQMAT